LNKKSKKGKVGVSEIADILGVSKSTVSRALNNHPKISKATKDKVKQVAIKLGYTPNIPDLMAPDQVKVIIVIIPEIETGYYREIINGAESFLKENDFEVLISVVNNSIGQVKSMVHLSKSIDASGIVLFVFDKTMPIAELISSEEKTLPFVLIHQGDNDVLADKVIPDIYQGVIKATRHLINNGSSKIALLLGAPAHTICFDMLNGYKAALQETGTSFAEELVKYRNLTLAGTKENLIELFSGDEVPDAIIAMSPHVASQSVKFLKDRGLKVPEDVMIVSLGGDSYSPLNSQGIASIKLNGREIGIDASRLLLERIKSPEKTPETIIKPVNFIIKGSAIRVRGSG
jgi:LacI family transcriptional regulator